MDHYDRQMAARVWQRVHDSSTTDHASIEILPLLQEEATDARAYRQLSTTLGSTYKPALQQLLGDTSQCISILRGIDLLLTGTARDVRPFPLAKELPSSTLRRCYGLTLRRLSRYTQWCGHDEYGTAFTKMADLCRSRCITLLQLLGSFGLN